MKANQNAKTFVEDTHGFVAGGALIGALILFGIAIYVAAAVLPGAIDNVENTTTTGWASGAASLWGIVGLVIVAGFLMLILRITGIMGGGSG